MTKITILILIVLMLITAGCCNCPPAPSTNTARAATATVAPVATTPTVHDVVIETPSGDGTVGFELTFQAYARDGQGNRVPATIEWTIDGGWGRPKGEYFIITPTRSGRMWVTARANGAATSVPMWINYYSTTSAVYYSSYYDSYYGNGHHDYHHHDYDDDSHYCGGDAVDVGVATFIEGKKCR